MFSKHIQFYRNLKLIQISKFCKKVEIQNEKTVDFKYVNGLPNFIIPLPSRSEKCIFPMKPISNNVGDFLKMIKNEDKGVDRAAIFTCDGVRIASSCSIENLLNEPFSLQINGNNFYVEPPKKEEVCIEDPSQLRAIQELVDQLYETLNIKEINIKRKTELLKELENIKVEVSPLEEKRRELDKLAIKNNTLRTWLALGFMSIQFGILMRLTFWEFSWDIVEPVTYFVGSATAIGFYAYYCATNQDYTNTSVSERQYLKHFYKNAEKLKFDVQKYNKLKDEIEEIELYLKSLKIPNQKTK